MDAILHFQAGKMDNIALDIFRGQAFNRAIEQRFNIAFFYRATGDA